MLRGMKIKLPTNVTVLSYQGFGIVKMKVENPYLKKYNKCNKPIGL
jgi:hypothetical protein